MLCSLFYSKLTVCNCNSNRFDHPQSIYHEDTQSGRLSVVLPLLHDVPDPSSPSCFIKFMCLGSDAGGPNRRPMQVIFTLENTQCSVLGRDILNIKICCCPKRDKTTEEKKFVTSNTLDKNEDQR